MMARFDSIFEAAGVTGCRCAACIKGVKLFGFPLSSQVMILCPTCGNKRCPHATNHENQCTGSNEPGQPGSSYQRVPL